MGGEAFHYLVPAVVSIAEQSPVAAIRAGILYVIFNFRLDDGKLFHIGAEFGHRNRPCCYTAVDNNGVIADDVQYLRAHDPLRAEALRSEAKISAVKSQHVAVGIVNAGKTLNFSGFRAATPARKG